MNRHNVTAILLALCVGITVVAMAQDQTKLPVGMALVTSVEGVTEYKLDNGLKVLLIPDASNPKATVNVTYLVGSRHESYGETGMAHLLEHLMFKGTPSHPNVPAELTKHGAMPNGTTNIDRTNYYESFAASDENLEWALDLEADRMLNSFIAKKDLDSEMTVVRNEMEDGENSPIQVLNERVMETAYLWHNYGKPTIGARSDVEGVPIERLQAFYHYYYQPDNAVLIVAGKFDEGKTLLLIQKKFGSLPKPTRVLLKPYTEEPTQDGPREVTLRRAGDVQAVIAAYHIPPAAHPDALALDVLSDLLNDQAIGRLKKRMVDAKLATSAAAGVLGSHDPGVMLFSANVPKSGDLAAARRELIKIAEGVAQEPFTQAELDRIKAQGAEHFAKMMIDGNRVGMALSETEARGDWRLLFRERDQLKKLTVADIQQAAAKYLVESNVTIGEFIPAEKPVRASIPSTPDLAEALRGYKGEPVIAAGEPFDPSPANIEARTTRTSVGAIKLALLPTKTRGQLVSARIQIHFGNEKSLMNRGPAAGLAGSLLMRGTAKHDMQQLQDALTAIKSQMSINGGATGVTVTLKSDREHIGEALKLAAEVLQTPTFADKEFDQLKSAMLSDIEETRSDPDAIAQRALSRALSPAYPAGHVFEVPTLDESIARVKAVTLADVKAFHREFYGIGVAEMAFVGDFDPKQVATSVQELFGEWKSPAKYERIPSLYKSVEGKSEIFNTPDKQNAVFMAATNLELRDDDPSYPALVIGNYMLGGGFLNSRLATRIRQKEGLSYGVSSGIGASALDKVGSFSADAICAPENYSKVAKAFHEELSRALAEGFTADELNAAKSGFLQSRQVSRTSDGAVAGGLAQRMFTGRDFKWDDQFESKIQALTPEQISRAMKRFIDPGNLLIVAAGDFSKAGN
jgi:zinc protease